MIRIFNALLEKFADAGLDLGGATVTILLGVALAAARHDGPFQLLTLQSRLI